MLQHPHPCQGQHQVSYFYLPASNGKPAEIIVVLNSTSDTIQIPVPEEDVVLQVFFQRSITPAEAKRYGTEEIWRIFNTWPLLKADHAKYNVSPAVMELLLSCEKGKPLQEQFVLA